MEISLDYLNFILFSLGQTQESHLHFGVICLIYLLGIAILFVEAFVPGGFLGVIGTGVVVSSIVLAYWHYPDNPLYGTSLIFISLVIIPSIFILMFRKITLTSSQYLEEGYTASEGLEALLDKEGIAITPLRPSGIAEIDGKRIDVTSENVMVEEKTPIKVVKVEGSRVVVKATGPTLQKEEEE